MSKIEKQSKLAPEPLGFVQRFVNTRNLMRDYDRLESPEQAMKWLKESGHEQSGSIREAELAHLREVRECVRDILLSHTLGESTETAETPSRLNDLVGIATLGVDFDSRGQPHLTPSSAGLEEIVEDLLIAVVEASFEGTWSRLKACANEACRWVFYDISKNRSGSWCVMEICGSRAKMRAYRERKFGTSIMTLPDPLDTP